jgi:glycosyltransferase involved in cell wall biosynthesis
MCAVDFTVRQFLLPLAVALREHGCRVTITCSRGPMFDGIRREGHDLQENPVSRSMNVFSHAAAVWRTYRLLRRTRFDVVHVHTPIAALIGRVAARLAGVPVIIYTAHGFYFHADMAPWKRSLHVALERLGAACGHFIMTVSDEDRQEALRTGIAHADTIETIYNGIDTARFDPARFSAADRGAFRSRHAIPGNAYVIGIVGRLVREKGFLELFDAVAALRRDHPRVRLLVVGDALPSEHDAGKALIVERARALGLEDAITWTGMVDDTAPWLAAMDSFALPSYREGLPVSLLEAMGMALPSVATNIRGCREEIVHGESGWLVPPRDSVALADRLRWFVEHPDEARQMGQRARQRVIEQFDIRRVLNHQMRIYDRLLRQRTGRGLPKAPS